VARDKTPMTTTRVAEELGLRQPDVYRIAKHPDTKLVRAKVDGGAVLFETWSVGAEQKRLAAPAE